MDRTERPLSESKKRTRLAMAAYMERMRAHTLPRMTGLSA